MISRTSRKPPASCLTLLGLRVNSSSALAYLPLEGLGGAFFLGVTPSTDVVAVEVPDAGISSHSSPAILRRFKKNGQSLVSITSDSLASAVEIGTGEDLIIAVVTSGVGNARRLRDVGVEDNPVAGIENNLYNL